MSRIIISDWVARESNTLRGFFTVADSETGIVLLQCSLHFGAENDWVGLPAAPQVCGGQAILRNGKQQYAKLIEIRPRDRYQAFQTAVLEALQAHPEASRCWDGGQ